MSKRVGDEIKTIKGKSLGVIVKQGKSKKRKIVRVLKLGNQYRVQYGNSVYDIDKSEIDSEFNTLMGENKMSKKKLSLMEAYYSLRGKTLNESGGTLNRGDFAYRIVDSKNGKYMSLFHGTKGSRTIPVGKWVDADVMQVKNPGTSKNFFKSGWHVTPSFEEAAGYLTNFRSKASEKYVLAKVQVDGEIRRKPRSRANVWLAEKMKIVEILGRPTVEGIDEVNAADAYELMDISPIDGGDEFGREDETRRGTVEQSVNESDRAEDFAQKYNPEYKYIVFIDGTPKSGWEYFRDAITDGILDSAWGYNESELEDENPEALNILNRIFDEFGDDIGLEDFSEINDMISSFNRAMSPDESDDNVRIEPVPSNFGGDRDGQYESVNSLDGYKKLFTENLNRLNSVGHNKYNMVREDYKGWRNRETWNVALWLTKDSGLRSAAKEFNESYRGNQPYRDFIQYIGLAGERTRDAVDWINPQLDYSSLNKMMEKI
jgi:hypothetical protein